MKISNRELFLKYALPCAETLVERGTVSPEHIDSLIETVAKHNEIPDRAENIFKTAIDGCSAIAKNLKKESIDLEVIREYFLFRHDDAVDSRCCSMGDFDPIECRTYPGRVLKIRENEAEIKTPLVTFNYKKDFVPDLKEGDFVIVHRNFIIEKIPAEIMERIEKKFGKPI